MNIGKDYQWPGLIGFIEPGFQAKKRKEKERYPVDGLALLQRRTDTKTKTRFSITMARSGQYKFREKPKDIGPSSWWYLQASQRRTASFGYYPSHSMLHPPRTPFNRFIPPWIWKGVGLDWRVKEGARSPKPKISTKTFPPTTHNTNRTQPFVLKNRLWKLKSADKHGEIPAFAKQESSTCLAV